MVRSVECIVFLILLPISVALVCRGGGILRGKRIDERSLEHDLVLARFNLLNALVGMPRLRGLTSKQQRMVGAAYLATGVLGLVTTIHGLLRLLRC